MVELAGSSSRVEWVGTFAQILLPGVVIGVLLGIAEHLRRTGGRRGWRWLAAAPVLFALAPQFTPGASITFITTGIGGAAIAITLAGVPALALVVGGTVPHFGFPTRDLSIFEPRGVWVALLFASLMAVYVFACSIPHRRVVAVES